MKKLYKIIYLGEDVKKEGYIMNFFGKNKSKKKNYIKHITTSYKIMLIIVIIWFIGFAIFSKPLPFLKMSNKVATLTSNHIYKINEYRKYGTATSSDFILYEVENIHTNQTRNLYYSSYKKQKLKWISDYVIEIDEYRLGDKRTLTLDVRVDCFDERLEEDYDEIIK